jgi:CheY-like chemotaxis protein
MPATVLICDDDEQVRSLIAAVLRHQGYDLRGAAHGQAALDELARNRLDLVILDVEMPGLDGLTVLKRIRGDPALAGTRVLLLSGAKEALDVRWSEQVGADAHLSKPFAVGALGAAVQSLLTG